MLYVCIEPILVVNSNIQRLNWAHIRSNKKPFKHYT